MSILKNAYSLIMHNKFQRLQISHFFIAQVVCAEITGSNSYTEDIKSFYVCKTVRIFIDQVVRIETAIHYPKTSDRPVI